LGEDFDHTKNPEDKSPEVKEDAPPDETGKAPPPKKEDMPPTETDDSNLFTGEDQTD
jgi:hypothetical protein